VSEQKFLQTRLTGVGIINQAGTKYTSEKVGILPYGMKISVWNNENFRVEFFDFLLFLRNGIYHFEPYSHMSNVFHDIYYVKQDLWSYFFVTKNVSVLIFWLLNREGFFSKCCYKYIYTIASLVIYCFQILFNDTLYVLYFITLFMWMHSWWMYVGLNLYSSVAFIAEWRRISSTFRSCS